MHGVNSDLPFRLEAIRRSLGIEGAAVRQPILDEAQFTNEDVLAVTSLSTTQLHNWVSRGWVSLSGSHNPGKGRRRLFSGQDVIAIELAQALAPYSLIPVAKQILEKTGWVFVRAQELLETGGGSIGRWLRVIPIEDDWLYVPDTAPDGAMPQAVYAYLTIRIDRLIIMTLERLVLVLNGEAVPPKDIPQPPSSEQTQAEIEAFYGTHDVDEQGRRVRSGLSFEETAEFEELDAVEWAERAHDHDSGPFTGGLTGERAERHRALYVKHEHGRAMKKGRDMAERHK